MVSSLDQYPSFPEDVGPCIQLDTISLQKLQDGNENEQTKLFQICQTRGFFYLDLVGTSAERLNQQAVSICEMSQHLFKLPQEEKMSYSFGTYKPYSLLGYKSKGSTKTDAAGTRDTAEFWNIGKDDILDTPGRMPVKYPSSIYESATQQLLADFQTCCHRTGLNIMSILAFQLGLPSGAFENRHRIDKPSDDHVRITQAPPRKTADQPEIATPGHTDFGSITVLFNWLGGLQIWSEPSRGDFYQVFDGRQPTNPGSVEFAEWLWVKPKAGCAIVNLGDAAVKFSDGLLCSARHRVVPPPGEQGLFTRHSVVYFVRPEDDTLLKRIEGSRMLNLGQNENERDYTTREWVAKQYTQLQEGEARQEG